MVLIMTLVRMFEMMHMMLMCQGVYFAQDIVNIVSLIHLPSM